MLIILLLNQLHGGKIAAVNFSILIIVKENNSVKEAILVVIQTVLQLEDVVMIYSLVHAKLLNTSQILFVSMKIMN